MFDPNYKYRLPFPIPDAIYEYDKVFNESHDNFKIFKSTMFKKLEDVLNQKKNVCYIGLGDSQTGKSYSIGSIDKRGLVYKSMIELLHLCKSRKNIQIFSSIYCVYENNIYDLLTGESISLKIRENKTNVFIEDLSEALIQNIDEYEAIYRSSLLNKRKLCQNFRVSDKHSFMQDASFVYCIELRNQNKKE